MNTLQHRRVEDLFDELVQLPPDHRAGRLNAVCGNDRTVRTELQRLLDDSDTLSFDAAPDFLRLTRPRPAVEDLEGSRIGPFHVLEQVGSGGLGVVYRARQRRPLKRVVAIKVIKPGFDTNEVVARFDFERQALARMDHPNIARVLDAGATDLGRPYFTMEYVRGVAITKFADDNRLSCRDRLRLFMQVCNAVEHAHRKSVIHRDIKAGNVLAYNAGGRAVVKVIDFGIAKALKTDRPTDLTFNTASGVAIGTYESMSPEQAAGRPDIDARTDVYSLGVLLYELLAGVPPLDKKTLANATHAEACRIITAVRPPRPSSVVAAEVAARRQRDVQSLSRELRRQLEWIPLKALRKDRRRRYQSVQEMADDVDNYLHGRKLSAKPDSKWREMLERFQLNTLGK